VYCLISLVVLIVSYALFKKAAGSLSPFKMNMVSWVFYWEIVTKSFIASVLVVNNIDNHYLINKISSDAIRVIGWGAVQYTMIAMPIGMLITARLMNKNPMSVLNLYLAAPIQPLLSKKDSYVRLAVYCACCVSLLSVVYVLYTIRSIPLLSILKGEGAALVSGFRIDVSRHFKGNIYIRNILAIAFTPVLSYIVFSYGKINKSLSNRFWIAVMIAASMLIVTYSTAKSPLVSYFLGFMFVLVLIDGRLKREYFVFFFCLAAAVIIFMYNRVGGVVDPSVLFSYNSGIIGRICLSQAAGTYLSLDLFPEQLDFIGFSSISNLVSTLLGTPYVERSARLLMETLNPKAVEMGVGGVYNSLFIAEAWANFGWVGLIAAPVYVGMVIEMLYLSILSLPKTPLLIGAYVFLCLQSGCVTGGFNDFIYSISILSQTCMLLLIVGFSRVLKINKELYCAQYDFSHTQRY